MEEALKHERVQLWHAERNNGVMLAAIEARLNIMDRDLEESRQRLSRLIDGGEGAPLAVRLNNLERDIRDANGALQGMRDRHAERIKGGWILGTALVSGLLGLIGTVLTLIFKK